MIEVILRPRRAGKTYELVKKASEENLYIICANRTQVRATQDVARQNGFVIPFPMTWQEFIEKQYYGRNINGFVIDNLDMCLQSMTPVEIKAVSLNGGGDGSTKTH